MAEMDFIPQIELLSGTAAFFRCPPEAFFPLWSPGQY